MYNLKTLSDGKIRVDEVDISSLPSDQIEFMNGDRQLEIEIENSIDHPRRISNQQNSAKVMIDIMCLYTPAALCDENGQSAECDISNEDFIALMDNKCELAIDQTNTAFSLSGVNTEVTLVYTGLIANDYTEERYMCSALGGMMHGTDSNYSHVRELRNKFKADLVTVIAKNVKASINGIDTPICGCGNVFNGQADSAFSVVNQICATAASVYSIAHEIGKLFLVEASHHTSHWMEC